jgi:hypothetical protein
LRRGAQNHGKTQIEMKNRISKGRWPANFSLGASFFLLKPERGERGRTAAYAPTFRLSQNA